MYPAIKYELQQLEALLATRKNHDQNELKEIHRETERTLQALAEGAITLQDETHVQRYVRSHHKGLVRLIDSHPVNKKSTPASKEIFLALEELLKIMEERLADYIDPEALPPATHRESARQEAMRSMDFIKNEFEKNQISATLTDVLLHPFSRLVEGHKRSSYHDLHYADILKREIVKCLDQQGQPLEEILQRLLIYVDFNSIKALGHWTKSITKTIEGSEARTEKLEKLSILLKEILQSPVKPGCSYNCKNSSLRDQLSSYLIEEIEHLQKVHLLAQTSSSQVAAQQNFKLKMEVSVSQLACFVKAMVEAKVIQNQNISELLRFLALTTITKRSEIVSFDSLRAKYYNIESGTKESVRHLLQSLLHKVGSD
jgi:hypothetical protein